MDDVEGLTLKWVSQKRERRMTFSPELILDDNKEMITKLFLEFVTGFRDVLLKEEVCSWK